jgi:hypothetical protein
MDLRKLVLKLSKIKIIALALKNNDFLRKTKWKIGKNISIARKNPGVLISNSFCMYYPVRVGTGVNVIITIFDFLKQISTKRFVFFFF